MKITTQEAYLSAFKVLNLMIAEMGNDGLKRQAVKSLAESIQAYETAFVAFPKPQTLTEMIELRMFEMRLKQKDLASLLDVETTRISEVLNGKRRISIELAKKLHEKLGIDGNFILETA